MCKVEWGPNINSLIYLCLLLIKDGGGEVVVGGGSAALGGDLEVAVLGAGAAGGGSLELWGGDVLMGTLPLRPDSQQSPLHSKARFPCGVITQGGRYTVRFIPQNDTLPPEEASVEVGWPGAVVGVEPALVQTYPSTQVVASLAFSPTRCQPALGSRVPETWLLLLYCGHSPHGCSRTNATHAQLMYSEQVKGYPRLRVVTLRCDLFGLAGHYALALRSSMQDTGEPIAATQDLHSLKAVWSEKFVFNVHARSIFPCQGGITVLFQYPACILEEGDKVRLFARPPTEGSAAVRASATLSYVSEQRVSRGRHSLNFDCSLFTEANLEYCFVYVSKAITGAVSDVRMDCVPTLPVLESEAGGWSEWSGWTQCSSTCSSGTRNRYRSCDSPPPRYGAKFCQGHGLETERCGQAGGSECSYSQDPLGLPVERPEVAAEVGPGCRCGCVVHLTSSKPRRLLAASAHSCPGRTFWLVQSDAGHSVRLSLEQLRLECPGQLMRIRDGDSTADPLLASFTLTPDTVDPVFSSGPRLLVEFTAGQVLDDGECNGGFLAHVSLSEGGRWNRTGPAVERVVVGRRGEWGGVRGAVNTGLALTLLTALVASLCLGLQYVYRYSKYHLAADTDSFTNGSCGSQGSPVALRSRATSSTTLLSEVISLKRFKRGVRHSRLQDDHHSDDEEELTREEELYEDGESKEKTTGGGEEVKTTVADVERRPNTLDVDRSTPQLPPRQRLLKTRKFKSPVSPVAECVEEEVSSLGGEVTPPPAPRSLAVPGGLPRPHGSSRSSSSGSSTLTNGSVNLKASKEKRNRERALAGSEFSLDLEMDYYDYNVQNAEPGSYLSMDPAYCLWIPPFAPGPWGREEEEEESVLGGPPAVEGKKCDDSEPTSTPEKETRVEKEPSIKFADEDEDEVESLETGEEGGGHRVRILDNRHADLLSAVRVVYNK